MMEAVDFDAEYRIYDGKTRLNGEELTRRFLSLHLRCIALEQKGAGWDELQAAGLTVALQRIDAVITPLISLTREQIEDLGDQILAVEARVNAILAGGIPAGDVAETASRVFVTPAQKLRIDATALATDLDALSAAVLRKSDKASTSDAQAGTDDTRFMTPAAVRAGVTAHPVVTGLTASFAGLRKDMLLTELLAAEAKGDRVNMSAGIVDPYNDTSDFSLVDALYSSASRVVSISPAKAYEAKTYYNFTSSDPGINGSYVYAYDSNAGAGPNACHVIFNGFGGAAYVLGEPGHWLQAAFDGSPIRSIELSIYLASGSSQIFSVSDPNTGAVLGTVNVPNYGYNGLGRFVIDLATPVMGSVRINFGNYSGSKLQIRTVKGYGARASDQLQAASITGYGRSWQNAANQGHADSSGFTGNGSPYRFDFDMGSPKKVGLIVNNGADRDRWFSFDVTGSNDLVSWSSSLGGVTNQNLPNAPIDFATVPIRISEAVAYRYYRMTPNGNATGETTRRAVAFALFGPPSIVPSVNSQAFAAAAVPTSARLGVQIKRYGSALSDLIGEVSRNGGASWSAVPLALATTQADGFEFVEGLADIAGQPTGQSMRYRLRSQNSAQIDIGGALLQWS